MAESIRTPAITGERIRAMTEADCARVIQRLGFTLRADRAPKNREQVHYTIIHHHRNGERRTPVIMAVNDLTWVWKFCNVAAEEHGIRIAVPATLTAIPPGEAARWLMCALADAFARRRESTIYPLPYPPPL